jgi:predicted transcriptional regulator
MTEIVNITDRERAKDRLIAQLSAAKSIAAAQADDPSLWFVATTATEAHLQHALRHLAAVVEGTLVSTP